MGRKTKEELEYGIIALQEALGEKSRALDEASERITELIEQRDNSRALLTKTLLLAGIAAEGLEEKAAELARLLDLFMTEEHDALVAAFAQDGVTVGTVDEVVETVNKLRKGFRERGFMVTDLTNALDAEREAHRQRITAHDATSRQLARVQQMADARQAIIGEHALHISKQATRIAELEHELASAKDHLECDSRVGQSYRERIKELEACCELLGKEKENNWTFFMRQRDSADRLQEQLGKADEVNGELLVQIADLRKANEYPPQIAVLSHGVGYTLPHHASDKPWQYRLSPSFSIVGSDRCTQRDTVTVKVDLDIDEAMERIEALTRELSIFMEKYNNQPKWVIGGIVL